MQCTRLPLRSCSLFTTDLHVVYPVEELLTFHCLAAMDLAYDHIVEQSFTDRTPTPKPSTSSNTTSDPPPNETGRPTLQSELQETFRAFSLSPWASKLGGLWGNVRKQGETYYQEARREAETASEEARRGLAELRDNLVKSTRALSFGDEPRPRETQDETGTNEGEARGPDEETRAPTNTKSEDDTDSRIRENDTFIARFRSEAAKRLKDIERAEDAADEALLRFGTNIRNFLRDAIAVAPPETQKGSGSSILFESKEPTSGRRVIHASRLDAQLHVIHTRSLSFTQDPETSEEQWQNFKNDFHIESKTDEIAQDLDRYPDLRRQMEDLVPEKVQYETFWQRYYFLRHVLAVQEERRRELLKGKALLIS